MNAVKAANLALRFVLELCALSSLAYWGFHAGGSLAAELLLGVGAPLVAALVWGAFIAPKAWRPVPLPVRAVLELAVFGAAVAALAAAGRTVPAVILAAAVVTSETLLYGLQ